MKFKTILLFVAIFILAISFTSYLIKPERGDHARNHGYTWEEYDSSYFNQFQTVQSLIGEADRQLGIEKRNTIEYYNFIAAILRKRFYHGFSHYSFAENPFASLSGKFFWKDLSAVVIPDDIMKYPSAACSQQSIVLMEVFKRNGIDFRKVGLKGHYCVEAKIDNEWRFFDTNMEPGLAANRLPLQKLTAEQRIDALYMNTGRNADSIRQIFSWIDYGPVNETPAFKARLFHQFCFFLSSKYTMFFLLGVILYAFSRMHPAYRQRNLVKNRYAFLILR